MSADAIRNAIFSVIATAMVGFLFGERAVQNLTPFITDMIKAKKGVV